MIAIMQHNISIYIPTQLHTHTMLLPLRMYIILLSYIIISYSSAAPLYTLDTAFLFSQDQRYYHYIYIYTHVCIHLDNCLTPISHSLIDVIQYLLTATVVVGIYLKQTQISCYNHTKVNTIKIVLILIYLLLYNKIRLDRV